MTESEVELINIHNRIIWKLQGTIVNTVATPRARCLRAAGETRFLQFLHQWVKVAYNGMKSNVSWEHTR